MIVVLVIKKKKDAKPIVDTQNDSCYVWGLRRGTSSSSTEEGDFTCIKGEIEKASWSQLLHLFSHVTIGQQFSLLLHQIFLRHWTFLSHYFSHFKEPSTNKSLLTPTSRKVAHVSAALVALGLPLDMFSPLLGCRERLLLSLDSWPLPPQWQCLFVEYCQRKSSMSPVHLGKDKRKHLAATFWCKLMVTLT